MRRVLCGLIVFIFALTSVGVSEVWAQTRNEQLRWKAAYAANQAALLAHVAVAQVAIRRCDYDKWVEAKTGYEKTQRIIESIVVYHGVLHDSRDFVPFPSYPFPCSPEIASATPSLLPSGFVAYLGGNFQVASSWNDYEDFPRFNGSGFGVGGQVMLRYYAGTNWFVGAELGGTRLRINASNPDGAFADYNWQTWEMAQTGFTFIPRGTSVPTTVYAGFGAAQGGIRAGIDTNFIHESMSKTVTGWALRLGAEVQVSRNVVVGVAYQHSQFSGDLDGDPVRAGINMAIVTFNYQIPFRQ